MVAGNPDKIAFIVEKVSDWSSCGCTNGVMQFYLNGRQYPKELRTTAIDGELNSLLCSTSPLINMPQNKKLFDLSPHNIVDEMCRMVYENGNYSYTIPLQELEDAGYYLFMVCNDSRARVVLAEYKGVDNIVYKDEITADSSEVFKITKKLTEFKESL